jgi:hypothetical protein
MNVCIYVCIYVCMYVRVGMHVCIYIRMYVRVYVCVRMHLMHDRSSRFKSNPPHRYNRGVGSNDGRHTGISDVHRGLPLSSHANTATSGSN